MKGQLNTMVPLIALFVFLFTLATAAVAGYHLKDVAFALLSGLLMGLFGAALIFIWAGWLLALS